MQNSLEELQATKIGHLVLDFAELTMRVTGAVDSLVEGVKAFGRQIEDRLKLENTQWEAVSGEHNSKVISLSSSINQAEFDINREKKVLSQELIPRVAELDDVSSTPKLDPARAQSQDRGQQELRQGGRRHQESPARQLRAHDKRVHRCPSQHRRGPGPDRRYVQAGRSARGLPRGHRRAKTQSDQGSPPSQEQHRECISSIKGSSATSSPPSSKL